MSSISNSHMENSNDNQSGGLFNKPILTIALAVLGGGGGGVFVGQTLSPGQAVMRDPTLERRLTLIETKLEAVAKASDRLEVGVQSLRESLQTMQQKKGR